MQKNWWLVKDTYYQPEWHIHYWQRPGFMKGLWAHNWNLVEILFNSIFILMVPSDLHKLSCHVQNCDLIRSVFFMIERHNFSLRNLNYELMNPMGNGSQVTLKGVGIIRADSRFAPSQWETVLLSNNSSHWLGASLESALDYVCYCTPHHNKTCCSIGQYLHHQIVTLPFSQVTEIHLKISSASTWSSSELQWLDPDDKVPE